MFHERYKHYSLINAAAATHLVRISTFSKCALFQALKNFLKPGNYATVQSNLIYISKCNTFKYF